MKNYCIATLFLNAFFILFFHSSLHAQVSEPDALQGYIPASPTASELGKYGEVPVELYNGLTQVSIPLVQLDALTQSIPVSLSYHSSGIKLDQVSGWVGMGWSLNAGGVITREIRDQPDDAYSYEGGFFCVDESILIECTNCGPQDENGIAQPCAPEDLDISCIECGLGYGYKYVPQTHENVGYLYNGSEIDALYDQPSSSYSTEDNLFLFGDYYYIDVIDVPAGQNNVPNDGMVIGVESVDIFTWRITIIRPKEEFHDTEPDVFNFNFGNYSGQFVFDETGYPRILSDQDLKIQYTLVTDAGFPSSDGSVLDVVSPFGGGITSFTVTTPDGMQYLFDQRELSVTDGRGHSKKHSFNMLSECSESVLKRPYETFLSPTRAAVTSWYLSEIRSSADIKEASFSYDTEVTVMHGGLTHSQKETCAGIKLSSSSAVTTTIGKRLSEIVWGNLNEGETYGSLEFIADTDRKDIYYNALLNWGGITGSTDISTLYGNGFDQPRALSKIVYRGDDGGKMREIDFTYDYFAKTSCSAPSGSWLEAHKERLKLTQVQQKGWSDEGLATTMPAHIFTYDPTPLPPRHSFQKDFWGFYNGNEASNMIPKVYAYPDALDDPSNSNDQFDRFRTIFSVFQRNIYNGLEEIVNYGGADRHSVEDYAKAGMLTQVKYPTGGSASFDYELHDFEVPELLDLGGGGIRIKSVSTSEGMTRNFDYTHASGFWSSGKIMDMPLFARGSDRDEGCPGGGIELETTLSSEGFNSPGTTKGGFVGYDRVEEIIEGNGKIISTYYLPASYGTQTDECSSVGCLYQQSVGESNVSSSNPYPDNFPFPPAPNYDWNRGTLEHQLYLDDDGLPVKEVTNTYHIYGYKKIKALKVDIIPSTINNGFQQNALGKYYYISGDKRIKESATIDYTQDGGQVNSDVTYGYGFNHKFPTSITTSNASSSQTQWIKYPGDITPADQYNMGVRNEMIFRYMIGVPLITRTTGDASGGTRTDYNYFWNGIYPEEIKRELQNGTWDLVGTVTGYNSDGLPLGYLKNNYSNPITYDWVQGQLMSRTYIDWTRSFTYFSNSRLMSSVTEIDGQTKSYTYNGLQRLKEIDERNGNIITSISYGYDQQNGVDNYVRTSIALSGLSNQEHVKYFDGLGRYTSTVNLGYGVDMENVVMNEVGYDDIGRAYFNAHYQTGGVLTEFDNSPLNRPMRDILSDNSVIQYAYLSNEAGEVPGYVAGTVYKSKVVDENGHPTFTYTDILGREVMIKDAEGGNTVYGYDNHGNISSVTTPAGNLYSYTYDNFNRMETKTIPGSGTSTLTYYPNHLPEYATDANGDQVRTIYDNYGRPLRILLNGELIVVNTYDTDYCGSTATGQLTSKNVRVLGESQFLTTNYCYDGYSRLVHERSDNYLNGYDEIDSNLDMADNLRSTYHRHQGAETRTIAQTYNYDHSFRMKENKHAISDLLNVFFTANDFQTLSYNNYNSKDQLIQKNLHRISGNDFLQQVDYRYNSRAWLTQINQVDEAEGDIPIPSCEPVVTVSCAPQTQQCVDRTVRFEDVLKMRILNKELVLECYQACDTVSLCDYTAYYSWGSFDQIDSVTANGNVIPLPNYPYILQNDPVTNQPHHDPLTADIQNWLTANGYQVSNASQSANARNGSITVFQTDFVFDAVYGFDVSHNTGVHEALFSPLNCNTTVTCDTVKVYCTPTQGIDQRQTLSDMRQQMAKLDAKTVSFPTKLNRVRMCTQEELYLLDQELPLLTGNFQILQQIDVSDPGQDFNIKETLPPPPPTGSNEDLFSMRLFYHQSSALLDAPSQRNGNISHLKWKVRGHTTKAYGFRYDRIDRLKKAKYAEFFYNKFTDCEVSTNGRYDVWNLDYDPDGNLLSLFRKGVTDICPDGTFSFGAIDLLDYNSYAGNRLMNVNDAEPQYGGVRSAANSMTYDNNGNLESHGGKGITSITYNFQNLPEQIYFNPNAIMDFVYDAEGVKHKKTSALFGVPTQKHYIKGIEYNNMAIEGVYHEEGRVVLDGNGDFKYEYSLKDHLGNTRVVFSDLNDNGLIETPSGGSTYSEVLQEDHYYPFGLNMQGNFAAQVGTENAYQYNGKELNEEFGLNWNDYGARWYDGAIGRWNTIDPLAEKYYAISPYCYTANNPIRFIDPDGMQIGDGKDHFEKFKKDVNSKISDVDGRIARRENRIARLRARGKGRRANRVQGRVDSDKAIRGELVATKDELNVLETSSQVYNLYTNSSAVGANAAGNIQYDIKTDAVNINVKGGYDAGAFAHELKHGYQFETGKLSFGVGGKIGGDLYDIQDEVEAYARGHLFGWSANPTIKGIQRDYPKIAKRLTQLTLSTPASTLPNSATMGEQMRGANISKKAGGKPPKHYYKDWKKEQ